MTLLRETPRTHGLLVDHDSKGNRRISVTLVGKTPRRNGRRLQSATGTLYNRCFQHVSTILWERHGKRLQPQDENPRQYHPVSEEAAVQIRLLLDVVARAKKPEQAEKLGREIAAMHPCESSWWYAIGQHRKRPGKVAQAISLVYA